MILLLTDLHCRFDLVNVQVTHAQERTGGAIKAALVLGDVGLYEPFLTRYFRRRRQRFACPVCVIEGNHEDFDKLPWLVQRYADAFTYLPRGSVHNVGGWRLLALGGAAYMDSMNTPQGSVIEPRDIERCLAHAPETVDLVISHDCPAGLNLANAPGYEHFGPPGFVGGERVRAHFRPRLWIFGHHHRWFEQSLDGTDFYGLPSAECGYGLLDEAGRVQFVARHIPPPPTLWSRIRSKFGGRRPQA